MEHNTAFRASLPVDVVDRTYAALLASFAPDTQENYAARLLCSHQFSNKYKVGEHAHMPTSHLLLTAFIAEYVSLQSGGTVKTWISGIKAWHNVDGPPWEGDNCWVELVRHMANKEGTAFRCKQCGPVTIEHMIALRVV